MLIFKFNKTKITVFKINLIIAACFILLSQSCDKTKQNADHIYYGGDILTMKGDVPNYAEALVTSKGNIVFTGSKSEALKTYQGEAINLNGKTMLPGFIDAHGHAFFTGFQALSANLLPPPDGQGSDINQLIAITKDWISNNQKAIGKIGWITGFGYDDAQLAEKRHPNADDLDKISTTHPVIFLHQSGHLGAMNHKALEMVNFTNETPNPAGGVIRRVAGTNEPSGVLEEMALFIPAFKLMASFDQEANEKLALAGLDAYSKFGFTTVQEGRATKEAVETWQKLASEGKLMVDLAAYPDLQKEQGFMETTGTQEHYTNHFRVAGIKLSLDGSPQGKTAWLSEPYKNPPPGQDKSYIGYPAFPDEKELLDLIDLAYQKQWQILAHCNGDAAADQYLKALELAHKKYGNYDSRDVMIHAQTVREDQIDLMQALGVIPSYFSMHTYYWGDWHRDETLGQERAYRISPTKSTLDRNMKFTQHHDAPVALPSSIMILHTTVNRISRTGDIIGASQKITPYEALKTITDWAAYQYFEEDRKGTLEVGKLADFAILDQNPLKIDPLQIINIKVLETIKEDQTVYKK